MALIDNLVSYWKLDEASGTRYDSHGSNDLSDNNTVTSATGKVGTAAEFNDSNLEYLSCTSNTSLQTGDIDFTIAAWVYRVAGGQGYDDHVYVSKDSASNREFVLASSEYYGANYTFFQYGANVATISGLTVNTWHFLVGWYDSLANLLYVQLDDGTPASVSASGFTVGSADFRIGARAYSGAEGYCKGKIDEVGFWKRVLTSGERTQLYNGGSGLAYPFSSGSKGGLFLPRRSYFWKRRVA